MEDEGRPDHKELHGVYDWMQYCPSGNCGQANPNYRKPKAKCKDCGIPLGGDITISPEGKETLSTPKCWNCGGTQAKKIDE